MASILRVNTLTDASSNNSIATSFVAGGSAKCWANVDQDSSTSIRDSLNTSGITDEATGRHTISFATNMGNAEYAHAGLIEAGGCYMLHSSGDKAAGSIKLSTRDATGSAGEYDYDDNGVVFHGDLA
tara:strand:+ start:247 stop:627 length:381 start_codon:yes stop_codon:yes gene_type:complete